ncbi:MAG: hypothetical protein A2Y73_00495 [Chloroflexi bacterium RBG_13_56_8]|nr:MAG: hypothetical protein A2Y73_00495 [Chloroflexi bacterium RBG_13_56_8]
MKVGINGAFWGFDTTGSGQYVHHLLDALVALAPQDEFILLPPRYTHQTGSVRGLQMPPQGLATPFDRLNSNLAKVWYEQIAFPRTCQRAGCDVAHVPYFAPPRFPSLPTVVTIHDLIPLVLPQYRGSRWVQAYMRLVSRSACQAALVLADSHSSAQDVENLLGVPPQRIRVVYLAADERYRPLSPEEREPALRRLGIPSRYLLYLGGFDWRKNVNGLLEAFGQVYRELDDVALVIAGQLPDEDSAFAPDPRKYAEAAGVDQRVHYTGWLSEEDKPALYGGALAFVFPSYYEGFGLPVLEALSCGTPAIVGGGSSLEEVAGPGGLVVPPEDGEALAEALVKVAGDPHLRAELAERGLQHAHKFSWAETARQTLAAYQCARFLAGR